jgi:hypothetical protein
MDREGKVKRKFETPKTDPWRGLAGPRRGFLGLDVV